MNAWARAAGKLARYEHIGWSVWPHSRGCAFQSGSIARAGSSLGSSRASWRAGRSRVVVARSGIPGSMTVAGDWPREGGEHSRARFGRFRGSTRVAAPPAPVDLGAPAADDPARQAMRFEGGMGLELGITEIAVWLLTVGVIVPIPVSIVVFIFRLGQRRGSDNRRP